LPVGSAIEGVDAGDNPLYVVLVVAHCHRITVKVISAGGITIAVACTKWRVIRGNMASTSATQLGNERAKLCHNLTGEGA